MKQDENLTRNNDVQIINILNIPIKKKWWFIGAFLIVFLSGVLFSFLRTPLYGSGSSITVTNIDPQVYKSLWELFPEDANKLARVTSDMITENLISEGIRSDLFLDDASKKLSFNISKKDLKNAIYPRIKGGISLIIAVVYSDPNRAYEINKTVVDLYLDNKNSEINDAYNNFLEDVDKKIKTDSNLSDIRSLLVDNREVFLKRIEITVKPELGSVYKYYDIKRDLIFSFFLSIAIGLLVVFIVNYIQSVKIKKNN